jgi:hypothetical protein
LCGWLVVTVGPTAAQASFLPPVFIDESTNFSQVINTNGAQATGGALLICEGEPIDKSTFVTVAHPSQYLCGNTLPNNGISDIVGFLPGVSALLIQMSSDKDADAASTPADTTPIPFPFINAPVGAIAEVLGPSGYIEYAPSLGQPGFYTDSFGDTPLYYITSDCQPVGEHLATCGVRNQIAPQCADPGGACGVVYDTFNVPEPESWALLLSWLAALVLSRVLFPAWLGPDILRLIFRLPDTTPYRWRIGRRHSAV